MSSSIRPRISSVYCDSRAGAVYAVEIRLGMNIAALANQVQAVFVQATDGFNGLTVSHGASIELFNPEWPGFEMDDAHVEIEESITF